VNRRAPLVTLHRYARGDELVRHSPRQRVVIPCRSRDAAVFVLECASQEAPDGLILPASHPGAPENADGIGCPSAEMGTHPARACPLPFRLVRACVSSLVSEADRYVNFGQKRRLFCGCPLVVAPGSRPTPTQPDLPILRKAQRSIV